MEGIMADKPLNELTATEAAAKIAAGEIASVQLVESCLERIAERDKALNHPWTFVDRDIALAQARACDAGPAKGPLHGIPVGVKDVIDTADMPTEYGSGLHKGHRPVKDSATVAAARAAGAVIIGKTATTEFASPWQCGVANPHDPARTPGVSSSGSAAAVADRQVPLAYGTQTGGSTICPASYCGIYGFKASLDGLDRSGIRHLKPGIDTLGLFARSLDDLALFRAGLTGEKFVPLDGAFDGRLRIGICRTPQWKDASPETMAAIETAAKKLGESGAAVAEVELPHGFDEVMGAFRVLTTTENHKSLLDEINRGEATLNPWIREGLAVARQTGPTDYEFAKMGASFYRRRFATLFDSFDALLTPSAQGEAPRSLAGATVGAFNSFWTWMYVPCVNLPAFTGPHNMPVGVQLVARQGDDARLLAVTRAVERALGTECAPVALAATVKGA
jgi:Asp-tRNA(Asn)/Glu-tRNA(Gln) amidotransferase A subunit family amidase